MPDRPTFKDIVEFAKAGWKPADVKEIIEAASKQEPEPIEEPAEITPKEEVQPEQEKKEEPAAEEPSKDDTIKQLQDQIAELNKKLQDVQEANTKKDLQGKVQSEEEKLNEIARSFM